MKRIFVLFVAMYFFTFSFSVNAFAATYKLSNQLPPSHHISKGIHVFAEKVKEYSEGKIEIVVFDSAQLYKDTEILEALQDGVVELGLVGTNKWGGNGSCG